MKKKSILLLSLAAGIALAVASCGSEAGRDNTSTSPKTDSASRVARGQYLVNTIGCDDCHSPKRMGPHGPEVIPELRLSGFPKDGKLPPVEPNALKTGWALLAPDLTAAVGPWGISYAANLTSDETGLGSWKEENFILAMREGITKGIKGSRPILPPMPWYNLKNLTDEDLKSMFAYLKSTPPVHNAVPNPVAPTALK